MRYETGVIALGRGRPVSAHAAKDGYAVVTDMGGALQCLTVRLGTRQRGVTGGVVSYGRSYIRLISGALTLHAEIVYERAAD